MQHVIGALTIVGFLTSTLVAPFAQAAQNARPFQVLSDPHGVGNPTHYTIVRGNSRVTFSHPIGGQFGRAEVTTRESGYHRLTRFILAPDRKTYRLALQLDTPFKKHFSMDEKAICIDPNQPGPLSIVKVLAGKTDDAESIAKKREELTKAKFFDASCFDPSIKEEHRNAIFNAAADVLTTKTQDTSPEPKYLRCLEKYGFAHESGVIQAVVKQSLTDTKVNPRVRLSCTADRKAKPGEFDDETRMITMKTTFKPNRDDYATKFFHEILHAAPLSDNTPLAAIEECCTMGSQCNVLQAIAAERKKGELKTTIAEQFSVKGPVVSSEISALVGTDLESTGNLSSNGEIKAFDSLVEHKTTASQCEIQTPPICEAKKVSLWEQISDAQQCRSSEQNANAKMMCTAGFTGSVMPVTTVVAEKANAAIAERKNAEYSAPIQQTSPFSWAETKQEQAPVQMRLGHNAIDPSDASVLPVQPRQQRTIASIAPLPAASSSRQLGSSRNRADATAGRATALVDTLEGAARTAASTLSPEKVELLKVDREQFYAPKFKPKSLDAQFAVISPAASAMKIADISGVDGTSFANPFAGSNYEVDRNTGAIKAVDSKSGKTGSDKLFASAGSSGSGSDSAHDGSAASADSASKSTATSASNATGNSRGPSANGTHDFKAMDRGALVKFMTSSYRTLSSELETRDFAEALIRNDIQVIDHENRRIGSMKPKTTFIYRSDLGRLVQTRSSGN